MIRWRNSGRHRILDFDIECRPLSWYGGDYVTKEITAIACKFVGEDASVCCWTLGVVTAEQMLDSFVSHYDQADMVTGHYIKGYDLPTVNSALLEHKMPLLHDKLAQDTKLDLVKQQGLSGSQENLAATLGIKATKVSMNQDKWRRANRLTPEGIEETRKRVTGDVLQHIEMRAEMLRRGMLVPPTVWSGSGRRSLRYTA